MKLFFTGFGPFGEVDYNPSWDAAQGAAKAAGATAELLEVTVEAGESVSRRVGEDVELLVHFGVASRRRAVCLERYAHNWWKELDADKPMRLDEGPPALEVALALDDWVTALTGSADLEWRVSHDAGTYVCNATLYHSLATLGSERALFVHIPPVDPMQALEIGVSLGTVLADLD